VTRQKLIEILETELDLFLKQKNQDSRGFGKVGLLLAGTFWALGLGVCFMIKEVTSD